MGENTQSPKPIQTQSFDLKVDGRKYNKTDQSSFGGIGAQDHNPIILMEPGKYYIDYPITILGDFDQLLHDPSEVTGVIWGWDGEKWQIPDVDEYVDSYDIVFVNIQEPAQFYFDMVDIV